MSTWNTNIYAVSGLDMCVSDITHTFVRYLLNHLPDKTFQEGSVYIDTLGMVNDHKRRENGLENPAKVMKPTLTVTTNGGITDLWSKDDGGPDIRQYSMFPGTTTDRNLVNNHRLPMLRDGFAGLMLDTIEIRRKLELTFKIDFDTKADLNTFKSFIFNTLPFRKHNVLNGFKTNIIMPNMMIYDLARLAFEDGSITMSDYDDVKKVIDYMNEKGTTDFGIRTEGVNDNIWMVMERVFRLHYFLQEAESKDGENSDKNSEVYDKFTYEFNAVLDFKLPNSYIFNYKTFNIPNKAIIDETYFKNVEYDKWCNVPVKYTNNVWIEDRSYIRSVVQGFELLIREEFFVEEVDEELQLSQFMNPNSFEYNIFDRLYPKERADLFVVHVYENGEYVEDSSVIFSDIISDMIYTVKSCDSDKVYTLYLYIDRVKFNKLIDLIISRIKNNIFTHNFIIGSKPPRSIDIDFSKFPTITVDMDCIAGRYYMYNSAIWLCLKSCKGIFPINEEYWKLMFYIFDINATYNTGDIIYYNGRFWVVTAVPSITGVVPGGEGWGYIGTIGTPVNVKDSDYSDVTKVPTIGDRNLEGSKIGLRLTRNVDAGIVESWDANITSYRTK